MIQLTPEQRLVLTTRYGALNLEDALIFVARAHDPEGRAVNIPGSYTRVAGVLSAAHDEFLPVAGPNNNVIPVPTS